ncbi:hypothetical protein GGS26DRAFT_589124 [Hypomontagnella submonticulosa]|nr:hypothetical protein GGS26DRAFT_589124 [Hypomontagnella submonticulosa]
MDWLSQTTRYLSSDLELFQFLPGESLQIQTVLLRVDDGRVKHEEKTLTSEKEYLDWIEECQTYLQDEKPILLFVMHVRNGRKASTLPYSKATFESVSKKIYQHRSLALAMPRTSTAIFNGKRVDWKCGDSKERSIVYNCRSDTETLPGEDDILLSTTYFTDKPWTFSTMYGCSSGLAEELTNRMKRFMRSAFHPLMFPMIFVEYERTRLMTALSHTSPRLNQRILDLENRLQADKERKKRPSADSNRKMTEKDCEGTKLWVEVSELKIGLESLKKVLISIDDHSESLGDLELRASIDGTNKTIKDSMSSQNITSRIQEMIAEIECKIRTCEGLLNGMALAIQVEWNYHTRRDAKANIIIAHASKQDSTQMRLISLVGMIFLPGTFLATLFSMSFFRWIPDDSADMVSPWIAIYFGLTAIITGATLWRWKTWKAKDSQGLEEFIAQVIDREDVEKGTTYSGDSELTRVNETNSHNESQIATVAGQKKEWEV